MKVRLSSMVAGFQSMWGILVDEEAPNGEVNGANGCWIPMPRNGLSEPNWWQRFAADWSWMWFWLRFIVDQLTESSCLNSKGDWSTLQNRSWNQTSSEKQIWTFLGLQIFKAIKRLRTLALSCNGYKIERQNFQHSPGGFKAPTHKSFNCNLDEELDHEAKKRANKETSMFYCLICFVARLRWYQTSTLLIQQVSLALRVVWSYKWDHDIVWWV